MARPDMPLAALILAATPITIWAVMLFARGGFWRARAHQLPIGAEPATARIAVVIPARDEADVIALAITSLLAAADADRFHLYLIDDASSDGTADAARTAADSIRKSSCLTVVTGSPRPAGWTGKLWAMQQGIARAVDFHPDFLLLTDADIVHSPAELANLVALAQRDQIGLSSLMVRLHCQTFPEKLLIPAFVFFFFSLYPPRWIADPRARTAGAAGGCMLIRPEALERAGGLAAIRSEIIDDCSLARIVKRSGGKLWLGLARNSASIRPYDSFSEIGRMIARTAFNQLQHSAILLALALLSLLTAFVLPIEMLFTGSPAAIALGAAAIFALTAAYLPMIRHYRLSPLWALTLPLAAVFYMGATLWSAIAYWTGSGGRWKGRVQDPST